MRRILADGNAAVMNLDLYDIENTRYLARQPWMMTCTDGRTPSPGQNVTHPRVFGAFTRKLRQFVLDEQVITMPVRRPQHDRPRRRLFAPGRPRVPAAPAPSPTSRCSTAPRIRDRATYEDPRQPAEGTVHVLVNGRFAIRDGAATGTLAGRPLRRPARAGDAVPRSVTVIIDGVDMAGVAVTVR